MDEERKKDFYIADRETLKAFFKKGNTGGTSQLSLRITRLHPFGIMRKMLFSRPPPVI